MIICAQLYEKTALLFALLVCLTSDQVYSQGTATNKPLVLKVLVAWA